MTVSIIVPIYNCEQWIESCLLSLCQQELQDIEILLVDDHGQDNSITIVQSFMENHKEIAIRLLETERNSGPGTARNIGIMSAIGNYIGFVDGDDYVAPTMFSQLYRAAIEAEAELSYCQVQRVFEGKKSKSVKVYQNIAQPANKQTLLTTLQTYSVAFLYKREWLLAEHIYFPNLRSAEDTNFLIKCVLRANRFASVNEPLYFYRIHSNSLTTNSDKNRNNKRILSFLLLQKELKKKQWDNSYEEELQYLFLKKALITAAFDEIKNDKYIQNSLIQHYIDSCKPLIGDIRSNPYFRADKKARLAYLLLKTKSRFWFRIIYRLLNF